MAVAELLGSNCPNSDTCVSFRGWRVKRRSPRVTAYSDAGQLCQLSTLGASDSSPRRDNSPDCEAIVGASSASLQVAPESACRRAPACRGKRSKGLGAARLNRPFTARFCSCISSNY